MTPDQEAQLDDQEDEVLPESPDGNTTLVIADIVSVVHNAVEGQ